MTSPAMGTITFSDRFCIMLKMFAFHPCGVLPTSAAMVIVNLHIKSIDQSEAIKTIKRKITDLDKMKIEEQKKAVRSGYDMDIIPSDLATFGNEAKNLLQDLQSRNERMFLLTFLVVNMADTKRKLENDIFAAAGIAQKYNCAFPPAGQCFPAA